ncbi:MAG: helix-turn-helix domain-containing protein [Saccharospirillum sp.]|nr:helix-turn-helix domain-containing protein [Saccharospirillum sp.]
MALYSFAAPALGRLFREFRSLTPIETFALWDLAQYFEYVVVLHGLYFVISHWRDDLVKSRRTARLIFLMVFGGAVGGAALSLNLGIYHELTPGLITSVASLVILACVVQAREGIFSLVGENAAINNVGSATTSDPEASTQAESAEVWLEMQALEELMQSGFYKTEKLTLKKLAGEVGIPEYRLRSLINQRLGYRNFNDYINQLRIAEASRRLSQDADIPILNVSLDVGFRSLSSFNRAFKDIVHCTPTEFRQRYFKAAQTDQKL